MDWLPPTCTPAFSPFFFLNSHSSQYFSSLCCSSLPLSLLLLLLLLLIRPFIPSFSSPCLSSSSLMSSLLLFLLLGHTKCRTEDLPLPGPDIRTGRADLTPQAQLLPGHERKQDVQLHSPAWLAYRGEEWVPYEKR